MERNPELRRLRGNLFANKLANWGYDDICAFYNIVGRDIVGHGEYKIEYYSFNKRDYLNDLRAEFSRMAADDPDLFERVIHAYEYVA